jgi:4-amino-4-deoxy-L-arabinose transferase-like glycosyltransferase
MMVRDIIPAFLKSPGFWLAGPLAFVVSVVVMLGMAVWFPPGIGMINNIIMPLVLFPLLWAVCFFYAYMSSSLKRVGMVFLAILIAHGALFFAHFSH